MATIVEIDGNIFNSKAQTIVNTINCDGVMGKGIALEFKKRYPDMFDNYVKLCRNNSIKPGILYLYTKSNPWILNFPTKLHWRFKSKIEYLELGLRKFSTEYKRKNITSIAFPKLGTMNGGLEWDDVKKIMYKYLLPLDNIEIEIYNYTKDIEDSLYINFVDKIRSYDVYQIKEKIGLNNKQSAIVYEIVHNGIKNFNQLEEVKGLGKKSIDKIKLFATSNINNIESISNKQLNFPF